MSDAGLQVEPRLDIRPAYTVAADHVRRAIHLGEYKPGDKFPPERQHAEQLGISRVTMREAIRILATEGYVEVRRGATGGVTVLDLRRDPAEMREQLRLRLDEMLDLQRFRAVNERLAAELAAGRATEVDLAALEASVVALDESEDFGHFRQADSAFHLGIAAAARSPLLAAAVEQARTTMFGFTDALDPTVAPASRGDHRRILDAVRNRDSRAAGRAMQAHVERTTRELMVFIEGS
jgi:GntR family transcriptional regulator, transcriptional repressor for pyruvate dehydrogenase complex